MWVSCDCCQQRDVPPEKEENDPRATGQALGPPITLSLVQFRKVPKTLHKRDESMTNRVSGCIFSCIRFDPAPVIAATSGNHSLAGLQPF